MLICIITIISMVNNLIVLLLYYYTHLMSIMTFF